MALVTIAGYKSLARIAALVDGRVAVEGFDHTFELEGILEREYGLKPSDVQWVVSTKDSSTDAGGKVSKQENMIP